MVDDRKNVTPLRAPARTDEEPHFRMPPANVEAEQALLGAVMVNNAAFHRVSEFLRAEHFAEGVHGRIYAAASSLIDRGQIANPVSLKNLFDQDGALSEIGGAAYLARIAASVVTIINAEDYGRTIHDLHMRRQLIGFGEDVVNDAYTYDLDKSATQQIETAEQQLFELATAGDIEGGFVPFKAALERAIETLEAAFKNKGRVAGLSTSFIDLDKRLGGLFPSDLVIIAGRPSMGKTALATNIAFNAARFFRAPAGEGAPTEGGRVGFFSLEMSAEQLAGRVLSDQSGVSADLIRKGEVGTEDFYRFIEAGTKLARIPLFVDQTPALTVPILRSRARRLKRTHGLDLIIVDYLQLMRAHGRHENRVQAITEITQGLKAVAKELNVPVVALSQLSRAVEQREDKRPMLSDLRESGSIEQDADVVMFVYREEYYLSRAEPVQRVEESVEHFNNRREQWSDRLKEVHGQADIIVAKQRHGPIGNVKLRFDHETTRFEDLAESDRLPELRF